MLLLSDLMAPLMIWLLVAPTSSAGFSPSLRRYSLAVC